MPEPAQQERGHLYKAETPSFNEGQLGKGKEIGGKVTAKGGEPLAVGNDGYASKLRKLWNSAKNASGRFPPF